jgi:hypothetical protein
MNSVSVHESSWRFDPIVADFASVPGRPILLKRNSREFRILVSSFETQRILASSAAGGGLRIQVDGRFSREPGTEDGGVPGADRVGG